MAEEQTGQTQRKGQTEQVGKFAGYGHGYKARTLSAEIPPDADPIFVEQWRTASAQIVRIATGENVRRAKEYQDGMRDWNLNYRNHYTPDLKLYESLHPLPRRAHLITLTPRPFPFLPEAELDPLQYVCEEIEIYQYPQPPTGQNVNVFGPVVYWDDPTDDRFETIEALGAYGSSPEPKGRTVMHEGTEYMLLQIRQPGDMGYVFLWIPQKGE